MSTSIEVHQKRRLIDLEIHERADVAQDLFIAKAKGKSFRSLAKAHNLTEYAVRSLITEYGAYLQQTRSHTKESGLVFYDYLIEKAVDIIESTEQQSALVKAKAFEVAIQAQTRKDKLLGHEAPTTNVSVTGETVADMMKRKFGAGGDNEDVSPMDSAMVGLYEDEYDETVAVEGEVVDDGTS